MINRVAIEFSVLLIFILFAYFYTNSLKSDISELKLSNSTLSTEISNKTLSNERLKLSLEHRNKEIENERYNRNLTEEKLKKWKALPRKIKYIHTPAIIKEIRSDECEDIKKSIDAMRDIDFNSL